MNHSMNDRSGELGITFASCRYGFDRRSNNLGNSRRGFLARLEPKPFAERSAVVFKPFAITQEVTDGEAVGQTDQLFQQY